VAKKNANFFDLHAEKIVIGLCVVLLIACAVYSLGGGRFSIGERGVGELCKAAGDASEQTRLALLNANPASGDSAQKDPAKEAVEELRRWFGQGAEGLVRIAKVQPILSRTQQFPPLYTPISGATAEERRNLAKLVEPDIPIVVAGEAMVDIPTEKPSLRDYDPRSSFNGTRSKRNYVSVAAQVDLVRQDANFIAERYPEGSYLIIAQVHLQRMDESNPRRGWEDVNAYLPFTLPDRPKRVDRPDGGFKFEGLDVFRQALDDGAEHIARPALPGKSVKSPQVPYLDEPPPYGDVTASQEEAEATRRVKKWTDLAKKAMSGRRPFDSPDMDAAFILARAGAATIGAKPKETNDAQTLLQRIIAKLPKDRRAVAQGMPRVPERLMPLVAHDLDVSPGHTYIYRMRYELYNFYAGQPGELANPRDAERVTVLSDWSPPSRPVEVTGDLYFYVTKADAQRQEVTVSVFRVTRKGSDKRDYKIKIGSEIGRKEKRGAKGDYATGAICVDIDFNRLVSGKKDVAMVYVDPADGVLRERLLSIDKQDKFYQKLSDQRSASR